LGGGGEGKAGTSLGGWLHDSGMFDRLPSENPPGSVRLGPRRKARTIFKPPSACPGAFKTRIIEFQGVFSTGLPQGRTQKQRNCRDIWIGPATFSPCFSGPPLGPWGEGVHWSVNPHVEPARKPWFCRGDRLLFLWIPGNPRRRGPLSGNSKLRCPRTHKTRRRILGVAHAVRAKRLLGSPSAGAFARRLAERCRGRF